MIEVYLDRVSDACNKRPPDWDAIRSAAMSLDLEARTQQQKDAVQRLKQASTIGAATRAAESISRAFLDGKPGADGWPCRC